MEGRECRERGSGEEREGMWERTGREKGQTEEGRRRYLM
jgi:hypothetical protein